MKCYFIELRNEVICVKLINIAVNNLLSYNRIQYHFFGVSIEKRANVVLLLGHWSMRSFEPQGSQLKRDDRLIRRRGSCRGLYLEMGSWAYKLILERVAQIDGSFCPEEQSSRSSGCHSNPKGHDTAFLAMNIHFHSECVWQHSRTGLRLFPGGTGISLRLHGDIISRFDFFICDIHLCG